jgi:hypothetical protein
MMRYLLIGAGWALMAAAPLIGVLPGPGGILLFAGGLALLLRNSRWAKRRYVHMKRRWPRLGRFGDSTLRRLSHRRRRERARAAAD